MLFLSHSYIKRYNRTFSKISPQSGVPEAANNSFSVCYASLLIKKIQTLASLPTLRFTPAVIIYLCFVLYNRHDFFSILNMMQKTLHYPYRMIAFHKHFQLSFRFMQINMTTLCMICLFSSKPGAISSVLFYTSVSNAYIQSRLGYLYIYYDGMVG